MEIRLLPHNYYHQPCVKGCFPGSGRKLVWDLSGVGFYRPDAFPDQMPFLSSNQRCPNTEEVRSHLSLKSS